MQGQSTQQQAITVHSKAVVLVVDDEKGPRESLRMILSSSHTVLTAEGSDRALEILRSRHVDLVTVDLNMPGVQGAQLVEMIRSEFKEIEIIIISGFATVDAAVAGIRQGVRDFLTKPFDVVQVNAAVSRAIENQSGRRRLVRFLEGVGQAIGHDQNAEAILGELDASTVAFSELLSNTIECGKPVTTDFHSGVTLQAQHDNSTAGDLVR
ncbi:MAG: DNA-binding NtrC family response regulator [Myxococcota bacterium]|jgi:DNA-binding NtrC family response regulator